jgi:hypothetical protein
VCAAKGAALTGNTYAGEAAEVLAGMSERDIDGGAQRLIVELGGATCSGLTSTDATAKGRARDPRTSAKAHAMEKLFGQFL